MDKIKIERKYKVCRWLQHICIALAAISCILPMIVASIKVAPETPDVSSKLAIGGVAIFFIVIISLILLRSFVKKFIANIPATLTVFISVIAMLLFLVCLKKIIDDAIAVLIVGAVGSFVGVIFEIVSMICKIQADDIKELCGRISHV